MNLYYQEDFIKIYCGDSIKTLSELPEQSVNCCVTSPPYWGLRDYGHDGQIGLESTPEEYVERMVEVFREVHRVLRDDGTLWLNLGDSYNTTSGYSRASPEYFRKGRIGGSADKKAIRHEILKPKDLLGIPWRVAFALQADGWYLRQDIIWHKPNPMPESVRDRCTKAHEYIFLFAKKNKYYYDSESIKIEASTATIERNKYGFKGAFKGQFKGTPDENRFQDGRPIESPNFSADGKANRRSVWSVSTKPFKGAHFATFPPDLIEPCVLAGCPEGGVVLDPFSGSGTTSMVARKNGRNSIGIEINEEYCEISKKRLTQTQ
jgi:DNA modification methylase